MNGVIVKKFQKVYILKALYPVFQMKVKLKRKNQFFVNLIDFENSMMFENF